MQHNLRYLEVGQPPLDEDFVDPDEEFTADQASAEIPPLRVAPAPPGYMSADTSGSGSLAPDSAVAPFGGPVPKMMPVIRHEQVPVTWKDDKGVAHKATAAMTSREEIPSPYKDPAAIGAPTSPGWVAGDEAENTLPFRAGALPAPAQRFIGKDRNLQGSLETARGVDAEMPIRPMPKLLNRIGAGALGAVAGWSNAAHRAAPIDIKAATDAVLYPGYDQKMASWQSRQAAAQKQVENFGQQVGAELASQKAQSEAQLNFARAEAAIKHGDYWERRSEQERNQWKLKPDGSLYNTITGQSVARPESQDARYKAAMAITGGDKVLSSYYALGLKPPAPTPQRNVTKEQMYLDAAGGDPTKALAMQQADEIKKARESRDPLSDVFRQYAQDAKAQQQLEGIGTWKLNEEKRINDTRNAEIARIQNSQAMNGADKDPQIRKIVGESAAALQNVQNEFARRARARNLQPDDYDVTVNPTTNEISYKIRPVTSNTNTASPSASPVRVKLPGGQLKMFPDQKAADAFAAAAGLSFSPAK